MSTTQSPCKSGSDPPKLPRSPIPDRTGAHVVGVTVSAGRLVKRFVIFVAHIGTNRKLAVSLQMHFPQGGGRITMRMGALSATLLVFLAAVGCVRRDGRNSDCKWPTEIVRHAPDARHLSVDAEFAEELAIRYADTHHGLHTPYYVSGEAYAGARERC